jgi:group I intron endonuclease
MVKRYRAKITGIYVIHNSLCNKGYVGSAVNMGNRWRLHRWELENNRHCNKKLQRAWNKYGEGAFVFVQLELCRKVELAEREQFWIDKLDAVKFGYNIQPNARTALGSRHSDKTKALQSKIAIERASSEAERKIRSERATRQHASGCLGRATWKPGTLERVYLGISERCKAVWADPEKRANNIIALRSADRTKQRAYLKSLGSDEMSRRAAARWEGLSFKERQASIAKSITSPGRSERISAGLKLAYAEGRR